MHYLKNLQETQILFLENNALYNPLHPKQDYTVKRKDDCQQREGKT